MKNPQPALLPGQQVVTRSPWGGTPRFLPAYVRSVHADNTFTLEVACIGSAKDSIMAGAKMSNVQRKNIWTQEDCNKVQ